MIFFLGVVAPQCYCWDKRDKLPADNFINLIKHVKKTPTFSHCLLVIWYRLQTCRWRPQTVKQMCYKFLRKPEQLLHSASDWLRLVTVSGVNFRFQHKEQWKIWGCQGITWTYSTTGAGGGILIAVFCMIYLIFVATLAFVCWCFLHVNVSVSVSVRSVNWKGFFKWLLVFFFQS